jgi:hypothetical protein
VDYRLKKLHKGAPTFLRPSQQVVKEMGDMTTLPPHVKLLTSDATAMYTHIESEVGIPAIKQWLGTRTNLPPSFPKQLVDKNTLLTLAVPPLQHHKDGNPIGI